MTVNSFGAARLGNSVDVGQGSPELWALPLVLSQLGLGKSTWLAGVKRGIYPQPIRLSPRRVAWRIQDIRDLIERLASPHG
jgi:hypothetical protein